MALHVNRAIGEKTYWLITFGQRRTFFTSVGSILDTNRTSHYIPILLLTELVLVVLGIHLPFHQDLLRVVLGEGQKGRLILYGNWSFLKKYAYKYTNSTVVSNFSTMQHRSL